MPFINTTEFYTTSRNNEITQFAAKWLKLENSTLSEVSHKNDRVISLICGTENS